MKTLLVLGQHPDFAEAVRGAVNPQHYHVVHRPDLTEAAPFLNHGVVEVCVMDAELAEVQGLWNIEKLRRQLPDCPLIVFTGAEPWEFEEEAYLHGVSHVLRKPVRARLLNAVLDRLWDSDPPRVAARAPAPRPSNAVAAPSGAGATQAQPADLKLLKDFFSILRHSLCAEAMLRQFLQSLREMLGVNRAAVFLRQPPSALGGLSTAQEKGSLRSACALGLAPGLLDHFQLSLDSGVGACVLRTGRILRRDSEEVQQNPEMLKEFEVLGGQVAIPVLDCESLLGVAVFDGRVTGEPISNDELELIFHLLEELGLALKNIWLHEQLVSNLEIVNEILQQLSSACVVVSRDLAIVQTNKKARALFTKAGPRATELEFSDLPHLLGSKIYLAFKTGSGVAPFKFSPPEKPDSLYSISILPFQQQGSPTPTLVLMVAEDLTRNEQLQKLEVETAQLRLLRTIAERLAHGIRNALVPISIHQQLLKEKHDNPEFLTSLDSALADGVRRILRLANQMKFLAREKADCEESIPLQPLLEEAFQEAQAHHPVPANPVILACDRLALKEVMAEIMLNALQANPQHPTVSVRTRLDSSSNGKGCVQIEVWDNGKGFPPEVAKKVPEPFFTTRSVGLGLGLTVCQKILATNHGRLEIPPTTAAQPGLVRVSLPMQPN
ncbi:MAG: ATP-binding protein [Verrucomicrobia bacterium]|nr:ATP-binding protein [Verrucomicrobiota bacterium]